MEKILLVICVGILATISFLEGMVVLSVAMGLLSLGILFNVKTNKDVSTDI